MGRKESKQTNVHKVGSERPGILNEDISCFENSKIQNSKLLRSPLIRINTVSKLLVDIYDFWVTVEAGPHECVIRTTSSLDKGKS